MGQRSIGRRGGLYFPIAGGLLLLLSVLGFSDNLFTDVGQPSNRDPKFIVHGLFCLAWMTLFAVQAGLVRTGNLRLHRSLGIAAMAVAAGVIVSTLYVFVMVWNGWAAMPDFARANRLLLPGFTLFVLLGFLNRARADRHKRLLYVATLYMMEPVLSRSFDPFTPLIEHLPESEVDGAWWIYFAVAWNGLFLSLFAYDWYVLRRIHPVSWIGYLGLCGAWAIAWLS